MEVSPTDQVRCPTCRAVQDWSDTCRRCKSDLKLLRAVIRTYQDHRRRCVRLLDQGEPDLALGHALRCHDLRPDTDSRRLLALCALAREEWETALQTGAIRQSHELTPDHGSPHHDPSGCSLG